MRMRTKVLGAALAMSVTLLIASPARADDLPPGEEVRDFIGAEQFFAEPRMLGDGWQKAVTAARAAWTRFVSSSTLAVDTALLEKASRPRRNPWPGLLRATVMGDRLHTTPRLELKLMPVALAPVDVVVDDGRGFSGVVVGARLTLPWMVP